jgi:hypothetical protein
MSDIQPGGVQPSAPSGTERPEFQPVGIDPAGIQPTGLPQFVLLAGSRLAGDGSTVAGASAFLRHLETSVDGATQFGLTDAAVSIRQPDDTIYSGVAPVQVLPDGAALTQELRTVWQPVMAGPHEVVWTFRALGTELRRVETYFVSWTDVASVIRRRLRETSTTLSDVDIDAEVAVTVQQLVDRFVLLQQDGGYAGLAGLDQERFDTAAAYLTALSLRYYRMKAVPLGEISSVRLNEHTFQFTSGQQKGERPIEQQWLDEALVSLGRVSRVQQEYAASAASFKPFLVSGPTRHKLNTGHYETLMSSVLRLITDRWDDGVDSPDYYDGYGQV